MTESPLLIFLLLLMSACLLVTAMTVTQTAAELREVLRSLRALLPHADQALDEARSSFRHAHLLLARANHATEDLEGMVREVFGTVSGVWQRLAFWRRPGKRAFAHRKGTNGAREDPRSYRRRREG